MLAGRFYGFFWLDKLPGMLLAMAVLAFFWSARCRWSRR